MNTRPFTLDDARVVAQAWADRLHPRDGDSPERSAEVLQAFHDQNALYRRIETECGLTPWWLSGAAYVSADPLYGRRTVEEAARAILNALDDKPRGGPSLMDAASITDAQLRDIFDAYYRPADGSRPRGVRPVTPADRRRVERIAAEQGLSADAVERVIYGKPEEADSGR